MKFGMALQEKLVYKYSLYLRETIMTVEGITELLAEDV